MKREIRYLEQELPKWQVLVDSVTGRVLLCLYYVLRINVFDFQASVLQTSIIRHWLCCEVDWFGI
jgi:hypothetical protein